MGEWKEDQIGGTGPMKRADGTDRGAETVRRADGFCHEATKGSKGTKDGSSGKLFEAVPADAERAATKCVDCAIHVHRHLGAGFKEVIYHRAFLLELDARGVRFESEKPILVRYKQHLIPGQKVDLLVEGVLLVEIKAAPKIRKVHVGQVLSYLRTMDMRLGLILNFNVRWMKDGIRRVVL